jgi:hypothetical protein
VGVVLLPAGVGLLAPIAQFLWHPYFVRNSYRFGGQDPGAVRILLLSAGAFLVATIYSFWKTSERNPKSTTGFNSWRGGVVVSTIIGAFLLVFSALLALVLGQ